MTNESRRGPKQARDEDYRGRAYPTYRGSRSWLQADDRASRGPYFERLIARHIPSDRDAEILDLGCGAGTLLHFLHRAGYGRAWGVDVSADQVALARELGNEGVMQGDLLTSLDRLEDATIRVVVTMDVIEHMTKAELLRLADGVHRVLKPGGRWIIHTPNGESPFAAAVRYGDWTHEQAFTRTSISQICTLAGFAEVRCYEDQPIPHGAKSAVRWAAWKVLRSLASVWWAVEVGAVFRDAIFSRNLLAVATKAGEYAEAGKPTV